jgi:putative heme-binding domain-containing protein
LLAVQAVQTAWGGPLVAPTDPLPPHEQRARFQLPPGFEIQLVAAEPEIQKPMNLAFDAQGRLWVTHSVEYPFAAEDPSRARDGVTVLGGFSADGRATQVTRFAEGLNIPIGVLPLPGGREVIVWSIPHIWKLTDNDGDGRADRKEVLYGPFDFVDTHGNQNAFRLGPDGWVYACHGFRNASRIKLRGEGPVVLEMQSGNTYRFRPDGTAIEQISFGQVNPFGMTFDSRGDCYTADCHSKPITLILRGGYYDSFGKPHDGLGFAPPMTGHDHGSTGIAGVAAYEARHFPAEYVGNLFVGNVITNTIHRDVPEWRGSSPWVAQPRDFVTCSDLWFRPVDLQLGPDGALYVADFYNAIIGHYEVDLNHPRRDRQRGRIWRIVSRGRDVTGAVPTPPNLANLPLASLVDKLSDDNLSVRRQAAWQLDARFGEQAVGVLLERIPRASPEERVEILWHLFRRSRLSETLAEQFGRDESALVRVHAVKAVGELPNWTSRLAALVRTALTDDDPFVRRAAAEALARHPASDNVRPLLQAWESASAADVQLIHALRIALRNQLRDAAVLAALPELGLQPAERLRLVELALAVPHPTAAWFAFETMRRHDVPAAMIEQGLTHVARHVADERLDLVAAYVQQRFADDVPRQAALFQSLFEGIRRRGQKLTADSPLGHWGATLAEALLSAGQQRQLPWVSLPLPGAAMENPWGVRHRPSVDGNDRAWFFDSLVHGEALTGVLRSAPFPIPERLTFWMCGHNGFPGTNPPPVNHVRLKLADTGLEVARAYPPRQDTAREFTWDLSMWAGQRGVIEVVDADAGNAYAWLAVGRFSPPVVESPQPGMAFNDPALALAVQIAEQLQLKDLAGLVLQLLKDRHVDGTVRLSAAPAALRLRRTEAIGLLCQIVQDTEEPAALRSTAAQLLGGINSQTARLALATALGSAPAALQQPFALALAGSPGGAEMLLSMIASGRASARLLQDRPILDRLAAVSIPRREERIAELTEGLPAADDRLKQLIARLTATSAASPDEAVQAGSAVFQKSCAACHRIADKGGRVGPQLDGVGNRGPERLLEDILDPNRNVDAAFRAIVVAKKDGQVVTGLKLREEGTTLIVGDAQGKEISIPLDEIEESRLTNLSPMPSNFSEQLTEADLRALVAFLLRQRQNITGP